MTTHICGSNPGKEAR